MGGDLASFEVKQHIHRERPPFIPRRTFKSRDASFTFIDQEQDLRLGKLGAGFVVGSFALGMHVDELGRE